MNNNQYLIPANTKKGNLIFNIFQPIDLTIFLVGVGTTLLMLVIVSTVKELNNSIFTLLTLVPGLVAVMLVFPFPNYHNIRIALTEVWCSNYEFKNK